MSTPTVSLVIPTYNVAAFLPEFLESLVRQTYPLSQVDLVFVIDGSPDDSETVVADWARANAPHATVIVQANAGLSAARNRGLVDARGEWVSFCDPDDTLAPDYLEQVCRFVSSKDAAHADLVACYITILEDATGELVDRHALRRRFTAKPRVVDLTREPDRLHLQSASAFYRRDRIEELGLRFDHRIRPNFEDAVFTARYLWSVDQPRIAFLPDAQYRYRKRADGTSLVQQSWTRPEKYVELPRHGYLDLLRDMIEARGSVPPWVQNLVLYDLFGYYREDDRPRSLVGTVLQARLDEFWTIQSEVLRMLDPWAIEAFRVVGTTQQIRLAATVAAGLPLPQQVWAARLDGANQTIELRYVYSGDPPDERLISRGQAVRPIWAKRRAVDYFGRVLYSERIVWVSATGTIAVELDGVRRPLVIGPPAPRDFRLGPTALWRDLNDSAPPSNASTATPKSDIQAQSSAPATRGTRPSTSTVSRLTRRLSRKLGREPAPTRQLWMLVDRSGVGGANVRALAAYLRSRPDIRVVVVSDMQPAAFDAIAYGSAQHARLLDEATVLVSAPLDSRDVLPVGMSWAGPYVSLTDGIWATDRSRVLDEVELRLLTTAGLSQHRLITGDATRSRLTEREVALTGLPHHDTLAAVARQAAPPRRLLVAPARRDLGLGRSPDPNYLRPWFELLVHPVMTRVRERGLRPAVVLPGGDPCGVRLRGVEVLDLARDPTEVLADTAVVVTDYGSSAFDVAALQRPVTYLQPVGDDYLSGRYGHRPSSWTAVTHGFGPVSNDVAGAADNLAALLDADCRLETIYAARMAAELPCVDGRACERVAAAIQRIIRPLDRSEAYEPVPPSRPIELSPSQERNHP